MELEEDMVEVTVEVTVLEVATLEVVEVMLSEVAWVEDMEELLIMENNAGDVS